MARTDNAFDEIDHIVVLMLENRSFDHMLGHLSLPQEEGGKGWNDVDGIGDAKRHINPNKAANDNVPLTRLEDTAKVKVDTPHKPKEVERQIQPPDGQDMMQGFVNEYYNKLKQDGENTDDAYLAMSYYAYPEVWALSALAERFTVCDKWFSPLAGPTQPNRMFALAGHANNQKGNQFPHSGLLDIDPVFEKLPEAEVSWRSYSHDMSFLRMVKGFQVSQHIEKISAFYNRARDKRLPQVSWIDPNFRMVPEVIEESQSLGQWTSNLFEGLFGEQDSVDVDFETDNSDHPDADIAEGQKLMARIYNALLKNDPTLAKTLFIITYDEHGGFYDHIIPPGWPGAETEAQFTERGAKLGVRVPSLAISGWLQGGKVCQEPLDHSTIVKTILEKHNPSAIADTPKRVQKVPSLWDALEWSDGAPTQQLDPLRKPRPRKNELREEMGHLARNALEQGTPVEKL